MGAAEKIQPNSRAPRPLPRVVVRARIAAHTRDNFWTGLDGRLTDGGVFVATRELLSIGTLVLLQVRVGWRDEDLESLAAVHWHRPYGNEVTWPGFGVRFIDVDPFALAKMRRFMMRERKPIVFDE